MLMKKIHKIFITIWKCYRNLNDQITLCSSNIFKNNFKCLNYLLKRTYFISVSLHL